MSCLSLKLNLALVIISLIQNILFRHLLDTLCHRAKNLFISHNHFITRNWLALKYGNRLSRQNIQPECIFMNISAWYQLYSNTFSLQYRMHRPGPALKRIGLGPNKTGPAGRTRLDTEGCIDVGDWKLKWKPHIICWLQDNLECHFNNSNFSSLRFA